MRGEDLKKARRKNLIILHDSYTWEEIATRSGTNQQYLSQIANAVIQKGGKTPRSLSDEYASKIEKGLGLSHGWMDQRHDISEDRGDYTNIRHGPDTRGLVPIISWVMAGAWAEADNHILPEHAEEFIPCPASHGLKTYALRVEGDSMTAPFGKTYPSGCVIYIDPEQAGGVTSGDRVIAKLINDNSVTFKVFVEDAGHRYLKPLNPQYPIITDKFSIIGKVIGKWEDD